MRRGNQVTSSRKTGSISLRSGGPGSGPGSSASSDRDSPRRHSRSGHRLGRNRLYVADRVNSPSSVRSEREIPDLLPNIVAPYCVASPDADISGGDGYREIHEVRRAHGQAHRRFTWGTMGCAERSGEFTTSHGREGNCMSARISPFASKVRARPGGSPEQLIGPLRHEPPAIGSESYVSYSHP